MGEDAKRDYRGIIWSLTTGNGGSDVTNKRREVILADHKPDNAESGYKSCDKCFVCKYPNNRRLASVSELTGPSPFFLFLLLLPLLWLAFYFGRRFQASPGTSERRESQVYG